MRTITFSGDSLSAVAKQIDQILQNGFQPTLAIVFSSVVQKYQDLTALLDQHGVDVIGATTAGEICGDETLEFSISGMLLDINKSYYRLHKEERKDRTTYQIAQDSAIFAKSQFEDFGMITVSGGLNTDGEEIIRGVKDIAGEDVKLYGGLAGDDFKMEDSFVFSNHWNTNDGILSLILDQKKISLEGIAVNGWQAVGVAKTVTHAEGNIVYSIDDEPALDVFIKYFGLSSSLDARKEVASTLGVQFPLQVQRMDNTSVIRAPLMGNNEDGSLVFAGGIPQGAKVKFSIPPSFDIIEQVIEDSQHLKNSVPDADGLILFSCKARQLALGPMIEEEISGMRSLWDSPMVGFFTYGEIGKSKKGKCDFHNETCSLVILKEI
ncbi:MAG: FIST signal transduction protein [Bacteroidia bacterium]